jgi:DNA modification methylase
MDHVSHKVEQIAPRDLRSWPGNARTHSKKQIAEIARSIGEFGFTNPILIDEHSRILAGHGRRDAARKVGLAQVPCVRIRGLTGEQKRALVLADNKLALNAGWDEVALAEQLQIILETTPELIEVTGFSIPEVDVLVEGLSAIEPGDPADDALPEAPTTNSERCRPGDVWRLGRHRLICGDALDPKVVDSLMAGEKAQMIFTDPPYNVPIDGHASGLGNVHHAEFAMASGEMSRSQFTAFLKRSFSALVEYSLNGSIHFVCIDWRHMSEVMEAADETFTELKNLVVWAKRNGGMGAFYRSRHELIFVFKSGQAPHINSFELGQHGRYRTNVWEYAGMSSNSSDRNETLSLHPTVKPVQMIADAIKDVSKRGGIVLDLFGGSGSTLIAAHKTGRAARLVEIDPVYCDRILARWEKYAHDDAQLLHRDGDARVPATVAPTPPKRRRTVGGR